MTIKRHEDNRIPYDPEVLNKINAEFGYNSVESNKSTFYQNLIYKKLKIIKITLSFICFRPDTIILKYELNINVLVPDARCEHGKLLIAEYQPP